MRTKQMFVLQWMNEGVRERYSMCCSVLFYSRGFCWITKCHIIFSSFVVDISRFHSLFLFSFPSYISLFFFLSTSTHVWYLCMWSLWPFLQWHRNEKKNWGKYQKILLCMHIRRPKRLSLIWNLCTSFVLLP
jgi:hypothetical protein